MDQSRKEYPAMLDSLQPSQAVAILNDRMRQIAKLNNDVADWLQERRRIEELYVQGLRKLARRQPPDETSELGIFASPWQRIIGATESMADSHFNLARKIESDVERPLREYATHDRQMQQMSSVQGNLAALARDSDSAQKKADKMKGRSRGLGTTDLDAETAMAQWQSQAPYAFETLQSVDESRCNYLRDVLTQFQTHEVDRVEKSRATAEQCLNSLLNVEPADEIKTFAIRTQDGLGAKRRSDRRGSRAAPSETADAPASTGYDEFSSPATTPAAEDRPFEKKSRLGGLRRFGTVMSRRKSTQPPPVKEKPTPTRLQSSSGISTSSNAGQTSAPVLPELRSTSPDIIETPPTAIEQTSTSRDIADLNVAPPAQQLEPDLTPGIVNGTTQSESTRELEQPLRQDIPPLDEPETSREIGGDIEASSLDPITQAEREAAALGDQQGSQLKVDILNQPISEQSPENDDAMARMASTLKAQAEKSAGLRRSGTNRGRREMRNTVLMPTTIQDEPAAVMQEPAAEPSPPATSPPLQAQPIISEERHPSDAQSIHSARSLGSVAAAIKHPDLQGAGLNASIVETINATMEHGLVTKAMIVGEVALIHNSSTVSNTEVIRFDNFGSLEKVATNPAFISPSSDDKPGEYSVDATAITRTSVALKYQAQLSDSALTKQAPLIITPSWKVEPNQTSAIISYVLNPAFPSAPLLPVTLSNAYLILHLEPNADGTGKPTTCMSKPAGTFSRERGLIYWRLDELTLQPGAPPQKLLARFATQGEAVPGRVEARWEIATAGTRPLYGGDDVAGTGLGVSVLDSTADPFADEEVVGKWKEVNTVRKLVSGTYVAT